MIHKAGTANNGTSFNNNYVILAFAFTIVSAAETMFAACKQPI